jgi:hypothetical protein
MHIRTAGWVVFALATIAAAPALTDEYICDDDGPCIVAANQAGANSVALRWSGQGTSYDFYRITARPHGGGSSKTFLTGGGQGGKGTFKLQTGDFEITVAGCTGSKKKPKEADCRASSEHVRMNFE